MDVYEISINLSRAPTVNFGLTTETINKLFTKCKSQISHEIEYYFYIVTNDSLRDDIGSTFSFKSFPLVSSTKTNAKIVPNVQLTQNIIKHPCKSIICIRMG